MEYWLGPDLNSDLLPLVGQPQHGPLLGYIQHVLADVAYDPRFSDADHRESVGENYYARLADGGFFALQPYAFEAGIFKDWSEDGRDDPVEGIITAINRVRVAGGNVDTICLDEPLISAKHLGVSVKHCAGIVAGRLKAIQDATGHSRFVLVEGYPELRSDPILRFLSLLHDAGVGPIGLHLDVDHRVFRHYSFWQSFTEHKKDVADCRQLATAVNSAGLAFGVILTPDGDRMHDAASFVSTALEWLQQIQEYFGGWPAHLIAQSWEGHDRPPIPDLTRLLLEAADYVGAHR